MPYNPSTGVYTLPPVYLAVPGTTIIAAQHNTPLVDLQDANNYARPILAGGTGADNAPDALTNLAAAGTGTINQFTKIQEWARGADLTAASSMTLGDDGNYFHVNGTGASIATIAPKIVGTWVKLLFSATNVIVHNSSTGIACPQGINLPVVPGSVVELIYEGSNLWRVTVPYKFPRIVQGASSFVMNTTTDVTVTGIGFRARHIQFMFAIDSGVGASWGTYTNPGGQWTLISGQGGTAGMISHTAVGVGVLTQSAGNTQTVTVSAVGDDGFTLSRANGGSPSATVNFVYTVFE